MKNFTKWLEGRKKQKLSPDVKAFISGKTTSVKLDVGKIGSGHQKPSFRTGAHNRKKTRAEQKMKVLRDFD